MVGVHYQLLQNKRNYQVALLWRKLARSYTWCTRIYALTYCEIVWEFYAHLERSSQLSPTPPDELSFNNIVTHKPKVPRCSKNCIPNLLDHVIKLGFLKSRFWRRNSLWYFFFPVSIISCHQQQPLEFMDKMQCSLP